MDKKPLSQYEIEANIIMLDRKEYPEDMLLTADEFTEIMNNNIDNWRGCQHKKRIEFLRANKYPVTHENMIDASLTAVSE